ncbi:MAG: glycoside-pentoside-hexuronide (GPH):cation symporter [Lachnospiraceae bacterium]|nr:glycoside-pentoside-hexuronide (GPH):cation symporter [Lachnospiraceae bacterium]
MNKSFKNMEPDAKISWGEKLGYSIGGQGQNFFVMMISAFLLVYYTNVAGMDSGIVATIIGVSKLLDGVSDIIAGRILDATKSKYGRFRTWMMRMIIPTAIAMYLLFNVPAGWNQTAQIIYVFITYNFANTVCLTMMNVANSALSGAMTLDQSDRGTNGALYILFGIVGGIILNSTVLQISAKISGGDTYSQTGWRVMILIYIVVFAVLTFIQFVTTRERVTLAARNGYDSAEMEAQQKTAQKKEDDIGVIEELKILIHDKYWVIFVAAMFCMALAGACTNMLTIYFAQYILDDVLLYTPLNNCLSLCALAGIVLVMPLQSKMKKRTICITGAAMLLVGCILPAISTDMTFMYVASALKGVGTGVASGVLPGMLQDSISYAQWQSGKDVLGIGNAAYSFTNKIGSSFGTIALGWLLSQGGFDGSLAVQPASAISVIRGMYIWAPIVVLVLYIVFMMFYDLDDKYAQISEDIKSNAKKGTDGNTEDKE